MIKVDNLSFTYPGKAQPVLKDISFRVRAGEFVLITGPTGCGKTTLLKCLNGIIPHASEGSMQGTVQLNSTGTADTSLAALSRISGLVQQNPDDQIFSLIVEDEIAFGPENQELSPSVIRRRVDQALLDVGLPEYGQKNAQALSGGQKQRTAIASILAMQPEILLLDEPTSQLDPAGAQEVLAVISRLHKQSKQPIVLIEHRIHEVAHLADRIIIMDQGRIVADHSTEDHFQHNIKMFFDLGLRLPETVEILHHLGIKDKAVLCEDRTLEIIQKKFVPTYPPPSSQTRSVQPSLPNDNTDDVSAAIRVRNLSFAYEKEDWILRDIDLVIPKGELVALLGGNGSGKSTLLLQLCGILRPKGGSVEVFDKIVRPGKAASLVGEVGVVFQDPGLMLFCDSVQQEILFGPDNLGCSSQEAWQRAEEVLEAMGLRALVDEPPQSLSGGQRLRAAVASVLSMQPKILLLDEPTSGQDKLSIARFMLHLQKMSAEDVTTVFITHDMETALDCADRIIVLNKGGIAFNGPPSGIPEHPDLIDQASLNLPKSLSLSRRLDLPPAFCAAELARNIQSSTMVAMDAMDTMNERTLHV
ncbi:MAG: ABC transporter ATP-binding protein [Candidatus Electrothrix sp. ATG1]|nr:ABC transporter ATP-binding protein [Candidatus Electrothrix sp. ATG1]